MADAAEWQTLAEKRQKQIKSLEDKVGDLEKESETAVKYKNAPNTYATWRRSEDPTLAIMQEIDRIAKLE